MASWTSRSRFSSIVVEVFLYSLVLVFLVCFAGLYFPKIPTEHGVLADVRGDGLHPCSPRAWFVDFTSFVGAGVRWYFTSDDPSRPVIQQRRLLQNRPDLNLFLRLAEVALAILAHIVLIYVLILSLIWTIFSCQVVIIEPRLTDPEQRLLQRLLPYLPFFRACTVLSSNLGTYILRDDQASLPLL